MAMNNRFQQQNPYAAPSWLTYNPLQGSSHMIQFSQPPPQAQMPTNSPPFKQPDIPRPQQPGNMFVINQQPQMRTNLPTIVPTMNYNTPTPTPTQYRKQSSNKALKKYKKSRR